MLVLCEWKEKELCKDNRGQIYLSILSGHYKYFVQYIRVQVQVKRIICSSCTVAVVANMHCVPICILQIYSWQMCDQLANLLHEATKDEEVKLVVLTGMGESFCSGLDYEQFLGAHHRHDTKRMVEKFK